jgi:hypothetical protein
LPKFLQLLSKGKLLLLLSLLLKFLLLSLRLLLLSLKSEKKLRLPKRQLLSL